MKAFTHNVTIRWSDINAYGVVSDAAIASYIEETRAALVREIVVATMDHGVTDQRLIYLTVRQRIDYLAPVRWQEQSLNTSLHILRIRPAATELHVRVGNEEHPLARARIVSVCWDTVRNRPRCLTDTQRHMLTTYLRPDPGAPN